MIKVALAATHKFNYGCPGRGRQIALALKLAAIAKACRAGARQMTTGNDSLNRHACH